MATATIISIAHQIQCWELIYSDRFCFTPPLFIRRAHHHLSQNSSLSPTRKTQFNLKFRRDERKNFRIRRMSAETSVEEDELFKCTTHAKANKPTHQRRWNFRMPAWTSIGSHSAVPITLKDLFNAFGIRLCQIWLRDISKIFIQYGRFSSIDIDRC